MDRNENFARQALEALEEARSQVGRLRRSVKLLQDRCTSVTHNYGSSGGSHSSTHQEIWDVLADRRTVLEKKEQQLLALEEKLERWIDLLPRPRWRMVLRFHYIDGLELSEVAQELSRATGREFSKDQIYRFHRKALDSANQIWPAQ